MSLAFLAKKSWHTANLKNVEKVWLAEQKHAQEEKKLTELKKQIEDERQIQELRDLQALHGNKTAAQPRLDWMYEGPIGRNTKETTEEYLFGKEYQPKVANTEQQSTQPGSLWSNTHKVDDTFQRLHEDPMLMIKKRQQEAQKHVLQNPVKMKRIKQRVEHELEEKKLKKKAKKAAKRERKRAKREHRDQSLSRSKSRSPDRHTDRRSKHAHSRSPKRRSKYCRSRSPKRSKYSRSRTSPRSRKHSESRRQSPRRYSERESSSESDQSHHETKREGSRHVSRYMQDKKYGLTATENAALCKHRDTNSLGPNSKFLEQARRTKEKEEQEKHAHRSSRRQLSQTEKAKLLEEMMQDASRHASRSIRSTAPVEVEATNANPNFIKSIRNDVYMNSTEAMEDRLKRNKHYIQRNADASNFMAPN